MGDGDPFVTALVLLLATVAVCWALGHWQPWRRQPRTAKRRERPGVRPRGSRRNRGAPAAARPCRPRATPRKRPGAPASPLGSSCSCGPCVAVARQLQELMALLWAGNGTSEPLYSGMWRALRKELRELVRRGHLPCCGSSRSPRRRHPMRRQLPGRVTIPGRASSLARMAQQQTPAIHARSSGCQRTSILPGASAISDSLHPSERLSETCQPAAGAEPVDRSPGSLGLMDITGTTLSVVVARESPGVQVGAQPDAGEPSQEQVAQEQQASYSRQLSVHSCQDAVAAGNGLCLVEETPLETPGHLHLEEAAPRQPPTPKEALTEGESAAPLGLLRAIPWPGQVRASESSLVSGCSQWL